MKDTAQAVSEIRAYLLDLQDRICSALEDEDGGVRFEEDAWTREQSASPKDASSGSPAHGLGGGGRSGTRKAR